MIRQKEKKTITWLLIAGMLHLMLIAAPSGMVMANPSETVGMADLQSVNMEMSPCHSDTLPAVDEPISQTNCDDCANSACAENCSDCAQINLSLNSYNLALPAKPDRLANSIFSPQPFDPGYTPTPHPPKQHHS